MNLLVLALQIPVLFYLFPLAAVISLVYSASRFEVPQVIIQRALRLFAQIIVFMLGVLLVLYFLSVKL